MKIAFLRGINVSGQKKILMADLRELLTSEGFENVQTYIQSGNIVFQSYHTSSESEQKIASAILKKYKWDVPVLVKTASEVKAILEKCPFSDHAPTRASTVGQEKKTKSYFTLLHQVPSEANIATTNAYSFPKEEFKITPECVYIYVENGYGNAKLSNNFVERKLKVTATTRNYKTLTKLLEMTSK